MKAYKQNFLFDKTSLLDETKNWTPVSMWYCIQCIIEQKDPQGAGSLSMYSWSS